MALTIKDLALVRRELLDVKVKWYDIGLGLELPEGTLKSIKDECKDNSTALREMLSTYLRSTKAHWRAIVTMLKLPEINEESLANRLEKTYLGESTTGSASSSNQTSIQGEIDNFASTTMSHDRGTADVWCMQLPATSRYKRFLQGIYNKICVASDDKLGIALSRKFIKLAVIKKQKAVNDDFSRSTLHGGVDEIRASKSLIPMEEVVAAGEKFILVEGPAGIGKSTLALELCKSWDTFNSLRDFNLVLLLKLRDKNIYGATSLKQIFRHRDEQLCKNVEQEVFGCEGEGLLLVLDGFDELPASVANDKCSLIMELINGDCLPNATRLVTSRPSAFHHMQGFPSEFRHIEIVGFTDESKHEFAEIAFQSKPELLAHFKKFILSNPVINSLMYIPINCAITTHIYEDITKCRKEMPKTMTQLYCSLILVLIRRHMSDQGENDSELPQDLSSLPELLADEFNILCKVAYRGLMKMDTEVEFTKEDMQGCLNHFGLMNEVKEIYVCSGVNTTYSFLHLSIQEFLAAWFASKDSCLIPTGMIRLFVAPLMKIFLPNKSYEVFLLFLCGILSLNPSAEKRQTLIELLQLGIPIYYSFLALKCIYESQDPQLFEQVSLYDVKAHLNTPMDMYMFGYCLVYSSTHWNVTISTSVEMLVTSLRDHTKMNDNKVLGEITNVTNFPVDNGNNLNNLPSRILREILGFTCHIRSPQDEGDVAQVLPNLVRLQSFNYSFTRVTQVTHTFVSDDYLIFQALKDLSIRIFTATFVRFTCAGIQALSSFIANSHTLKEVNLDCVSPHDTKSQVIEPIRLYFRINTQQVVISAGHLHIKVYSPMCKKSLHTVISIMNYINHYSGIFIPVPKSLDFLPLVRALSKPNSEVSNLKRTHSLSTLISREETYKSIVYNSKHWIRRHSCPDLREISNIKQDSLSGCMGAPPA